MTDEASLRLVLTGDFVRHDNSRTLASAGNGS